MNTDILKRIGLTEAQAKVYAELVKAGKLTPPQLAKAIDESRTTAYMALAKLEEIGLARKLDHSKKQTYIPVSPSALNSYLEAKKRELTDIEEQYRAGLSDMLSHYYAQNNQPGLTYIQGKEGLRQLYEDHLKTGKDQVLVRTYADEDHFGDWLYDYMDQRAKTLRTDGLMPFDLSSFNFAKKNNQRLNRETNWYPAEAYTAPVEFSAYGDKLSIISFGNEPTGMIIENPEIAKAFKELYQMAKLGAAELMKQREEKSLAGNASSDNDTDGDK